MSPLIGLWVHTFNHKGEIEQQGHIIRGNDSMFLVELFSWITGEPTSVVPFSESELLDPNRCALYADGERMRLACHQKEKGRRYVDHSA